MTEGLTIDCDGCVMQHTSACDDCVVTFICNREPDEAVIIDVAEERAVRMLIREDQRHDLSPHARRGELGMI